MFSVPVALLAKEPAPESAVPTVSVPLFWYAPVIATLAMEIAFTPLNVFVAVPVKVCVPVLAVKVPSFCKFPPQVMAAAAVSLQVPPLLIVTLPVKVCVAAVALLCSNVPLTVVTPLTVKSKAPTVSCPPELMMSVAGLFAPSAAIVTVCPFAMMTVSPAAGTPFGDQVHALPQLPVAALVLVAARPVEALRSAPTATSNPANQLLAAWRHSAVGVHEVERKRAAPTRGGSLSQHRSCVVFIAFDLLV